MWLCEDKLKGKQLTSGRSLTPDDFTGQWGPLQAERVKCTLHSTQNLHFTLTAALNEDLLYHILRSFSMDNCNANENVTSKYPLRSAILCCSRCKLGQSTCNWISTEGFKVKIENEWFISGSYTSPFTHG